MASHPMRPQWARDAEVLNGTPPLASSALRLRLCWIVFQDAAGNFVIVDPERPRQLGTRKLPRRPPTLYFAATDEEIEACAEAMLPVLEERLICGRRQSALLDRVREARNRIAGFTPAPRLSRAISRNAKVA